MPPLPAPQAILFDVGNSIIREIRHEPRDGFARLLKFFEIPPIVEADEFLEWACGVYAEMRRHHESDLPIEVPLRPLFRLLVERFGMDCQLAPDDLELEFWKGLSTFVAEPGVADVLESLNDQGMPVGAISNSMFSARPIECELDQHGLLGPFRFVMSSADYGVQKPHPAIFETALTKLGLQSQEVWFIGDSYSKDVLGAIRSGLRPVWYNRKGMESEGGRVMEIRCWGELGKMLDT